MTKPGVLQPVQDAQDACALAATLLSKLQSADGGADQSPEAVCGVFEVLGGALGAAGCLLSSQHMFISHCLQRVDAILQSPAISTGGCHVILSLTASIVCLACWSGPT